MKQAFAIVTYDQKLASDALSATESLVWFDRGKLAPGVLRVESSFEELAHLKSEREKSISPFVHETYRLMMKSLVAELHEGALCEEYSSFLQAWLAHIGKTETPREIQFVIEQALKEEFFEYTHHLETLNEFAFNVEESFKYNSFVLECLRGSIDSVRSELEERSASDPSVPSAPKGIESLFSPLASKRK